MKAIVRHQYGSSQVLQVENVQKPIPKENEVLIKIQAASINAIDWRFMKANPFFIRFMGYGFLTPKKLKVLGFNIAGHVEAIGSNVEQFKVGDAVFGACSGGGFAEYVCTNENAIVLKPTHITFEQAAATPSAAITALQGLRDAGGIQAGQRVMIHGASGGVGTFAVQIAKFFGAEVTAVCSTRNVQIARSIGADYVIDYKKEDFASNGQQYDLIFGINGNRSIFEYNRALSSNGTYVMSGGDGAKQLLQPMLFGKWLSRKGNKKLLAMATAKIVKEDLLFLQGLLESGEIHPVIDDCYPLSQTRSAFQYIENSHAQGKVIISMA